MPCSAPRRAHSCPARSSTQCKSLRVSPPEREAPRVPITLRLSELLLCTGTALLLLGTAPHPVQAAAPVEDEEPTYEAQQVPGRAVWGGVCGCRGPSM